jgi:hypothetical protein
LSPPRSPPPSWPRRDDERRRHVDVTGDHWDGSGLDVETHNGGIRLTHHDALGSGGPRLRAITTNGGVTIGQR